MVNERMVGWWVADSRYIRLVAAETGKLVKTSQPQRPRGRQRRKALPAFDHEE